MITLTRLFAATLLLCAFPGATGGQEKTAPSIVVIANDLEKLRTEFDSSKRHLEERLDRIESLIGQLKYPPQPDDTPVEGNTGDSSTRSDDSDLEGCCRHINHHVPCCRHVDYHEPCCRHTYREPCCKHVYHVYHPRRAYRPRPCCTYTYHPAPCCVTMYDPEPWLRELD